jgi:hypothetical protein
MGIYANQEQRPRLDIITARQPANPFAARPTQLYENLNRSPRVQSQLRLQSEINQSPLLLMQAKLASTLNARMTAPPASGPVAQRLILGAEGDLDTQDTDSAAIDRVVAELQSLDYDSLAYIRELLDPTDERDRSYIKLINYELGKADSLHGIVEATRYGGISSSAAVFVDGQLIGQTDPTQHPFVGQNYYQYVLKDTAAKQELNDEYYSRVDAEVATLEEAYELLQPLAAQFTATTQIRIALTGTSGPCDGCKARVDQFRKDVLDLLPDGGILSIDSSYLNATSMRERVGVETRYGYEAQTQQTSASGERYYNYRYPLRVKGQD